MSFLTPNKDIEHTFDLRTCVVPDYHSKLKDFALTHFDVDPDQQGFVTIAAKFKADDDLPPDQRPLRPDRRDKRPYDPSRNLAKELSDANEEIKCINDEIFRIKLDCKFQPDGYSRVKIKDLEKKKKEIMVPEVIRARESMVPLWCSKTGRFAEDMEKFHLYRLDTYLTANRYKIPRTWNSSKLYGYSNIVTDIDLHIKDIQKQEKEKEKENEGNPFFVKQNLAEQTISRINRLVYILETELFGTTFDPNTVVFTGRGIQLWTALDHTHASSRKMFKHVAKSFCTAVQTIIDCHPEIEGFEVDFASSTRDSGLFRMPCSYNKEAGTWGNMYIRHVGTVDLYEEYSHLFEAGLIKCDVTKKSPKTVSRCASKEFCKKADIRIIQMQKLLEIRYKTKLVEVESRDLLLFVVFNAVMSATGNAEEATKQMLAFNKKFQVSLPAEEANSYMTTSIRVGGYKLTNKWIIDKLQITEEEQAQIGLYPVECKRNERKNKKEACAKLPLDPEILRLCKEGYYQEEIARMVGCSPQTVMRVLRANGVKTAKQALHDTVIKKFRHGARISKVIKYVKGKLSIPELYHLRQIALKKMDESKKRAEKLLERKKQRKSEKEEAAKTAKEKEEKIRAAKEKKEKERPLRYTEDYFTLAAYT